MLTVHPGTPLRGEVALPGDKSISHRAILFSLLAKGESRADNLLVAGVTRVMLEALTALRIPWDLQGSSLVVQGKGWKDLYPSSEPIYCGHSATTMRLLAGALAAANLPAVLDGSEGLRKRPMQRIIEPLQEMGVPIKSGNRGNAPLILVPRVNEGPLRALNTTLPVASAQVKSALLLAGLDGDGATVLREPRVSRDHTERMLKMMGVNLEVDHDRREVTMRPPDQPHLEPFQITIPGDFSSAAFLIVAALVTPGSEIILRNVGMNPTRTGLLDLLLEMGANIEVQKKHNQGLEPVADLVVRSSNLQAVEVRGAVVPRMIDEFPIFTIGALHSSGTTSVSDAEELRYKESDRIGVLSAELGKLGLKIDEKQDGYQLEGKQPLGKGRLNPQGDHRLAMSFVVAGLAAEEPVTVQNPEIIAQSFPNFVEHLQALGAKIT
jgi:3-phosphoshikimate 1-carboxyvinyltransferase